MLEKHELICFRAVVWAVKCARAVCELLQAAACRTALDLLPGGDRDWQRLVRQWCQLCTSGRELGDASLSL